MVRLSALLLLSACSVEGTVLVVHEMDATLELPVIDAGMDTTVQVVLDANPPVPPDTRGVCRIRGAQDGFYESFPNMPLDATRWLIADGVHSIGGAPRTFARENVSIEDGDLILRVGLSGAAVVTRDLFSSATYQVQGRFAGAQIAVIWQRDDANDGSLTIATPGADGGYGQVTMQSRDSSGASENQFAIMPALDDGSDHILRFDRYTTNNPSVRFWVDDMGRWSTSEHLPSMRAGRMWIVAYATNAAPATIRISNAFVTPFGNDGDLCTDGELAGPGLVLP